MLKLEASLFKVSAAFAESKFHDPKPDQICPPSSPHNNAFSQELPCEGKLSKTRQWNLEGCSLFSAPKNRMEFPEIALGRDATALMRKEGWAGRKFCKQS